MAVVKSFSVPEDVAEYLDELPKGSASAVVTALLRRQMLNQKVEKISGRTPDPETKAKARAWAKRELAAARADVDAGAYDEIRQQMGYQA